MKELAPQDYQDLDSDTFIYNSDHSFAKVIGKDKDKQLRMYGLGVTTSDVYGEKPSHATLLRQAMDYKSKYLEMMEKYDILNDKLDESSTNGHMTQLHAQSPQDQQVGTGNNVPDIWQRGSTYVPDVAFLSAQVDSPTPSSLANAQCSLRLNSLPIHIKVTK